MGGKNDDYDRLGAKGFCRNQSPSKRLPNSGQDYGLFEHLKCFLEIDAIALETPPMSGGMRGTSTLCSYLEGRKQIWPVRSHGAGIVRSDDPFTQLRPSR